jgi:hypothetical protein
MAGPIEEGAAVDKWGVSGRRGSRSIKAMRTIGALSLAIGFVIMGGSALANGQVCPPMDSGKIDETGKKTTKTVTAPDGYLIDEYCVKAGSEKQGLGPEFRTVSPPQKSVTISHSSEKDISHYSLSYVAVEGEPEPDPEPTETPSPNPDPEEECEEEEEGDEEGEDEGEEDEEGEEECEEEDSEPTTPPTTPPTNNPGGQGTTTPPASQTVTQPAAQPVTQPVTQPAPQPVPVAGLPATDSKNDDKDEVKGVVITKSSAKAEALPATLAFTGPRDQLPILWTLAGLFITTGLVLQIIGRRKEKLHTSAW